jgi:hypothetical protein
VIADSVHHSCHSVQQEDEEHWEACATGMTGEGKSRTKPTLLHYIFCHIFVSQQMPFAGV